MRKAAVQHDQDAQDNEQVFEPACYHLDSELDLDLKMEMNNSEDELIHQIDEDLKQEMTNFIPRKAHMYKETAMSCSTRCSNNVRKRRRVKKVIRSRYFILK